MRARAPLGVAIALALTFAGAKARATIMEALSLRELVRRADLVLVVTCVSERASRDERRRIVTDYGVRVDEVLEGDARVGERYTVRRLGGEIGDIGMRIEGEPRLEPGARYVVFLRAVQGVMRPVGMSQGVLPLRDEAGVAMVQPGGFGLALVRRGGPSGLVPAPPALRHPEPLDRLRARVASIVGER